MTMHKVKSWTHLFQAAIRGEKTSDIRDLTERDYRVGDMLLLQEYDMKAGSYTGREATFHITHIISNSTPCALSSAVLKRDYGILSIRFECMGEYKMNQFPVPTQDASAATSNYGIRKS